MSSSTLMEELALEWNKRCPVCQRTLPKSQFHRDPNVADGRYRICRECKRPRSAEQMRRLRHERAILREFQRLRLGRETG